MGALPPNFRFHDGYLSKDPLQCFVFIALIVSSYFWMQEHSDRANQPMLPVVRDDDGDALYLLLVAFHKPSMIFKGRDILPAAEAGGIN